MIQEVITDSTKYESLLSTIKAPTQLLWGEEDEVFCKIYNWDKLKNNCIPHMNVWGGGGLLWFLTIIVGQSFLSSHYYVYI